MDEKLFIVTYLLLWCIVLFHGFAIVMLFKRLKPFDRSPESGLDDPLAVGSQAPSFAARDIRTSDPVNLPVMRGGLLVFLSLGCPACQELAESLAIVPMSLPPMLVVCKGSESACSSALGRSLAEGIRLVADSDGAIAALYKIRGVPALVRLDHDLRIHHYGSDRDIDELSALAHSQSDSVRERQETSNAN